VRHIFIITVAQQRVLRMPGREIEPGTYLVPSLSHATLLIILLVSVSGPGQLVFRDGVHPGWRPHVSAHQVRHLPGVPRQVSPLIF
jgi:hypothetical protein